MKFRIETLGCKVNQYESQQIREALLLKGYAEAADHEAADITVINTCTVTHRSDSDARSLIRRSLGSGRVVVTGCLASTENARLKDMFPNVDIAEKNELERSLGTMLPKTIGSFSARTRAFVKIQDGCSNFCSYCIVPYARGGPVSRPADEIISEINRLSSNGCSEIILCGINLGLYDGGITGIMKRILDETPMPRIRLSSMEPWTVRDDLLGLFTSNRICPHFHLPLQSGSAKILSAMGRPHDTFFFSSLVERIIDIRPETAIGTDIMAGFPGETERDFLESLDLTERLPLAYLHVFPYSRRPGTLAAGLPFQVDDKIKKQRVSILRALSERKRAAFLDRMTGEANDVLVTGSGHGICKGVSSNYITAVFRGSSKAGDIVKVRFEGHNGRQMKGSADGQS